MTQDILHFDLCKLNPKPEPHDFTQLDFSPVTKRMYIEMYEDNLAIWNHHQTQLQEVAQQVSDQQRKTSDKYCKLLQQYEELRNELIVEVESHAQEKQEIQELKNTMNKLSEILHNIMKK